MCLTFDLRLGQLLTSSGRDTLKFYFRLLNTDLFHILIENKMLGYQPRSVHKSPWKYEKS